MIVYTPLWETMKKKKITKSQLVGKHGLSPSLITRLKRNQSITMETVNTLCDILDCQIGDIAKYIKDDT